MKKYFPHTAIILPIIIMLCWIISLELPSYFGTEIRLKIQGYDPGDLLSGQYLRFQVVYDTLPFCENIKPQLTNTKCVCLGQPANKSIAKATWTGNCNERPENCGIYIQGTCKYSQFIAGIERYYFPEKFKITTVPQNANVVLKVLNGKASVQDIEVNGTPLLKKSP